MHISALFRLGPILVGGLAFVAAISAQLSYAAPDEQVAPTSGQSVSIDSFAFTPAELSLPVGATLTWANAQAGVPHTSSSVDGLWDSDVLTTGDTFSFTFNQAGDFAYQCDIHPSMRGIVHVGADAVSTTTDVAGPQAPAAPASIAQSLAGQTNQPSTPTPPSVPNLTPTVLVPVVTPTPGSARHVGY
jgi:plastocyanin